MNKFTVMKRALIALVFAVVVGGYTCAAIFSGHWLMCLAAVLVWLCVLPYSLVYLFWWLSKKEKEATGNA